MDKTKLEAVVMLTAIEADEGSFWYRNRSIDNAKLNCLF